MDRIEIPSNTPWDASLPYSRAVRIGSYVALSQTSSVDSDGSIQGGNDPLEQARHALGNIRAALKAVHVDAENIIRTRIYLSDLDDWKLIAPAYVEFLGSVRPAVSLIQCKMVSAEILVEFEVDAIAM